MCGPRPTTGANAITNWRRAALQGDGRLRCGGLAPRMTQAHAGRTARPGRAAVAVTDSAAEAGNVTRSQRCALAESPRGAMIESPAAQEQKNAVTESDRGLRQRRQRTKGWAQPGESRGATRVTSDRRRSRRQHRPLLQRSARDCRRAARRASRRDEAVGRAQRKQRRAKRTGHSSGS